MSAVPIVIDASIAAHLPPTSGGCSVVPRQRVRGWRSTARGSWQDLELDQVIDVLCDLPGPALVLVRSSESDPGNACLGVAAAMLGHEVITLPMAIDEAVWSVGVALGVCSGAFDVVGRMLDVVCCGPGCAPAVARQPWGPTALSVPALRPATLARWAFCAWRPCRWCSAGGLPGFGCRRCGVRIDDTATEVAA